MEAILVEVFVHGRGGVRSVPDAEGWWRFDLGSEIAARLWASVWTTGYERRIPITVEARAVELQDRTRLELRFADGFGSLPFALKSTSADRVAFARERYRRVFDDLEQAVTDLDGAIDRGAVSADALLTAVPRARFVSTRNGSWPRLFLWVLPVLAGIVAMVVLRGRAAFDSDTLGIFVLCVGMLGIYGGLPGLVPVRNLVIAIRPAAHTGTIRIYAITCFVPFALGQLVVWGWGYPDGSGPLIPELVICGTVAVQIVWSLVLATIDIVGAVTAPSTPIAS